MSHRFRISITDILQYPMTVFALCFLSGKKVSEGIILKISLSCWDRREDMASPLIGRVKSSTKREKGFQKAW